MTISRNLSFLAEGVSSTGVLGATYGGTGQNTVTTGDLLYGSATNTWSKLSIGSTGTILRVVGGIPSWGTDYTGTVTSVAASVPSFLSISGSPITTSGTLAITYSGTALPVANGGTGLVNLIAGYIPFGNGTGAFSSSSSLYFDGSNLLVGTTTQQGNLTVLSSVANQNVANFIAGNTGASQYVLNLQSNASAANTAYLIRGYNNTSTGVFFVAGNGNVTNATNSYGAISDAKLKQNIVLADSQWNDVKALGSLVKKYSLISDETNTIQIGMVAQDVQTVSPKLVISTQDINPQTNESLGTSTLSVNYSVMYMKAFKALSEALVRIETLEARLQAANIA
jgi:hypothetical protein